MDVEFRQDAEAWLRVLRKCTAGCTFIRYVHRFCIGSQGVAGKAERPPLMWPGTEVQEVPAVFSV